MSALRWRARAAVFAIALVVPALLPCTVHAQGGVPLVRFTVSGFEVSGDNPLSEAETQAILKEFAGEHSGLEGLQAGADELEAELFKRGYTFHRVVLPPQRALGGVIRLEVVAFKVGRVSVSGNKFFTEENILRSVPALQPDGAPNTTELARQIDFANEHGSKNVSMKVTDSEQIDRLDVDLTVADADPVQVYLTGSNTGSAATGRLRTGVGFQHNNLTGHDDGLTVTYTTSPDHFEEVFQGGLNYRLPFYGKETSLSVFGTYSDVDSGTVADIFEVSGKGQFWGVRLEHKLPKKGSYSHKVTLNFDDKFYDNDVDFTGIPLGVQVRSRPVGINYTAAYERPKYSLNLSFDYAVNWETGADNNDLQYAASRAPATSSWDVVRTTASVDYRFDNGWALRLTGSAQVTDDSLIAGEQFGIGGATSVRGFEEREEGGDQGWSGSFEVWSPTLLDSLQVIGFVDHGYRRLEDPQPGESKEESLTSAGVGLRWTYAQSLSVSLDYAEALDDAGSTKKGDHFLHGNVLYRF
ncbi:MAG: ShlB/FhaC/HecB family hemolysin secretion/activation protein [Gammaproteobacteria bacterium]